MSIPLRALLLSAVLGIAAIAQGQINIVNFDFGAVPIACSGGYAYQGPELSCPFQGPSQNFDGSPGFGWILGTVIAEWRPPGGLQFGGVGLTGPNTNFQPPPFTGLPFNQAVILEDANSFVWQGIGGFTPGSYSLSFYLGSRYIDTYFDGNQTVQALIDGQVIGTWALTSFTPFTLQTAAFTIITGSTHMLEFRGINRGDHTAFVSYVTITPTDH